MKTGFLYIVYKNHNREQDEFLFFKEALISIKSLRKFTNLPIYIKTDYPNFFENCEIENLFIEVFERISHLKYRTHQKLFLLEKLPFHITFFVDSDTLFINNPEVLISEDFDVQICREVCWKTHEEKNQPMLLRGFNSGFFIATNSEGYRSLIGKAIDIFHHPQSYASACEAPHFQGDQWYINQAFLHVFNLSIKILPSSWNLRPPLFPLIGNVITTPNLLHARGGEFLEGLKLIK